MIDEKQKTKLLSLIFRPKKLTIMSDSDDAPIELSNKNPTPQTTEHNETNEADEAQTVPEQNLPPKKRKRNRKLKNTEMKSVAIKSDFTPPPSTNSVLASSPSMSMQNSGKSDYDLKLEELLRRAEDAEDNADVALGEDKAKKTQVRKRKHNVVKRFRCVDTDADQKTAYRRLLIFWKMNKIV